ncbi:MAG: hypothetical protein ACW99G_11655 [Candidatus Thorarchaeota archaeon]|jgi:hypothetical protein
MDLTDEQKDSLVGTMVTLDGREARIGGRHRKFPVVWQVVQPFNHAEYSWSAIFETAVRGDGNFER